MAAKQKGQKDTQSGKQKQQKANPSDGFRLETKLSSDLPV